MNTVLIHKKGDDVGVAVRDIESGEEVAATHMDDGNVVSVKALDAIPLGHKIALRSIPSGDTVIEYGEQIGVATSAVSRGQHVHIQNLKSARWSLSTR
ncbi:MAG: UxaA family hydrolase [Chloroflexota bacterium]